MTQEEMKAAWESTARRLESLEQRYEGVFDSELFRERRTALDNLAIRYKNFSRVSLIMTGVSLLYMGAGIIPEQLRVIVCIYMMFFFALAGSIDWWLYKRVKSINVVTMSAEEVAGEARRCKKTHLWSIALLLPMALGLIWIISMAFNFEKWTMIAIAAGFLLGVTIGIRQFISFMADYRLLR